VVNSVVATIISLISAGCRPSAHVEESLADLGRQRIPVKEQRKQGSGGARKHPLGFKNAHAAGSRSNESREVIWGLVEKQSGVWQVFPGVAVIQWPEDMTR
jgi:hypothetical protein